MILRFALLFSLFLPAFFNISAQIVQPKTAQLVLDAKTTLGEGAIWDNNYGELLWLDIEESKLFIYNPAIGGQSVKNLPQKPGTVVPAVNGSIILALQSGIFFYNRKDSTVHKIRPALNDPGLRFNDGKCDPRGRLWVGSMSIKEEPKKGKLYMFDLNGNFQVKIDSTSISNGIVWSADHKKMYYIDTPTSCVMEYKFDENTGNIDSARIAIKIPKETGYPDGMTIDKEGKLWIAQWGGFGVYRWDPLSGKLLEKVNVPAKNVTSCAFGGDKLDVLYITTARKGNTEEELVKFPLSGGLFKIRPGVSGVPATFFGQNQSK